MEVPLPPWVVTISTRPAATLLWPKRKWSVSVAVEAQLVRRHEALQSCLHGADDASRLSSRVKSEMPGTEKEVKTEGKVLSEKAASKLDSAVC